MSNTPGAGTLSLSLAKPGEDLSAHGNKLSLNLAKPSVFSAELFWDSPDDLDAHALLGTNNGPGARITSLDQVLSTYNSKGTNAGGALTPNADGSFSTPEGALRHSGDCRDGVVEDVDETITIDGSKIPAGINEIPIFVTIHPAGAKQFSQVKSAGIRLKDSTGAVLGEYMLTSQFGEFDAVQMGSLMLDEATGWHYAPIGVGIKGDFNTVLGFFAN